MINYFGSKVQNAHRYPPPRHRTIVEPFAGGAGYSLLHHTHDVVLVDLSRDVIGAWQWLIAASPDDVMALPLIEPEQHINELACDPGARLLISWCLNQTAHPVPKLSSWGVYHKDRAACYWGVRRRAQMAMLASRVKHWVALVGDYRSCPDVEATWFIDPPYVDGGKSYPHHDCDYAHLAQWSRERRGQAIVCERVGATWLPFEPLYTAPTAKRYQAGARKRCSEAVWCSP